jgi:hypothetical protein
MTGLGTGRCGYSGCENPCPVDEDFCCTGCEEACNAEDEELARTTFGLRVDAARASMLPTVRERIEALDSYEMHLGYDDRGISVIDEMVKLADVLALFAPDCSLCEAGHVPVSPCGGSDANAKDCSTDDVWKLARTGETVQVTATRCGPEPEKQPFVAETYPHTAWDEDAGVWVEWENAGHGKVVPPPDGELPEPRVEPGF